MKKNTASILIPLFGLIGLIILFIFLKGSDERKDVDKAMLKEFAIRDTASLDMIRITHANNATITVSRRSDSKQWVINDGEFEARQSSIDLILETVFRIRVKQDVDASARAEVMKQLSVVKREVEFFRNGESEPFKTYYIGNPTPDKMGTYMMLRHGNEDLSDNEPYITHKPGMYGHLESRFFTNLNDWKSPTVFKYSLGSIAKAQIQFFENPQLSHIITRDEQGTFHLFDNQNTEVTEFDRTAARNYLNGYSELNYESINKQLTMHEADSVIRETPYCTISITDQAGDLKEVVLHRKAAAEGLTDYKGDQFKWDKDRLLAHFKGKSELFNVQYYSWGAQFKPITFFTGK